MRWLIASLIGAITLVLAAGADAQDKVRFDSLDADLTQATPTRIEGLLYRQSGAGPFAAVVLLHGCGGLYGRDGIPTSRHYAWAWHFHSLGYVVLHVDSFTPRDVREICTKSDRTIQPGRERVRDAYGALAFLQTLPEVRPDQIFLLGWSNGGSTTLAAVDAELRTRPRDLVHDFRAAIAFYPGCRSLLERRTGWTTSIPLLILIGASDDWTPAPPCQSLIERAKAWNAPVDIHVYADAHHGFDAPNTKLRVRRDVATTRSGTATIGTHPQARDDAVERAPAFFARHLTP